MYKLKTPVALLRITVVFTAAIVLVGGVTYAALQSQNATLQGNKISSATANLQIGDGIKSYAASMPGFDFSNVEPGGPTVPAAGYRFNLFNSGSIPLKIKVNMTLPSGFNTSDVNLNRIYLVLSPQTGPNAGVAQNIPLGDMITGNNPTTITLATPLAVNQGMQYVAQISMESDAVSSHQVQLNITSSDFIFSGSSTRS